MASLISFTRTPGSSSARCAARKGGAVGQRGAHRLDVLDPEGQLLQARAGAADELRDRRLGRERREQLDAGVAVADGEHRLADALLLVRLLVHGVDAEGLGVEGDRFVEIGNGDADVVDRGEQLAGQSGLVVGHAGILPPDVSDVTSMWPPSRPRRCTPPRGGSLTRAPYPHDLRDLHTTRLPTTAA